MIFNLLGTAVSGAVEIFKTRSETKQIKAKAEREYYNKMLTGEIEYSRVAQDNMASSYKDEYVLFIVSLPLLVLGYAVFFGDEAAKEKLDLFFTYFNDLPQFYQWLVLGIFGAVYGLKPGLDLLKKK
jgi:hypothetical protein|tara:strand:+ start:126 stop:506 length:381 start_codon:yes stop_codon:yes gene_type:complete